MENPFSIIDERLKRIESMLEMLVNSQSQLLVRVAEHRMYLTIAEASEITRIAKSTLYQMTATKRIPHIKRGMRVLFKRDELIDWLQAGKQ